jgi:hypothetical protein
MIVVLLVLSLAMAAMAQYEISRDVIGNGGGEQNDASYFLIGTLGQAVTGQATGEYVIGGGYWYPSGESPSDVLEEDGMPAAFAFAVGCPNPVQSVANLRLAIPKPSRVVIKLYDVSGRRVRTLVDGELSAGHHQVKCDAAGLSGGVYFARMEGKGFKQTRRLILLR